MATVWNCCKKWWTKHRGECMPVVLFSAREAEAKIASKVAAAFIKSRSPDAALRAKVEELLATRATAAV